MQETKAAIKVFTQCCPLSTERVCAIQGSSVVVIDAIKTVLDIILSSPIKGPIKLYDPYHFDSFGAPEYGGHVEQGGQSFRSPNNRSFDNSFRGSQRDNRRPIRGNNMGPRGANWREPLHQPPPDAWIRNDDSHFSSSYNPSSYNGPDRPDSHSMYSNRWLSTGKNYFDLTSFIVIECVI